LLYPYQVSQTIFQPAGTPTYTINLEYAVKARIEYTSDGKEIYRTIEFKRS